MKQYLPRIHDIIKDIYFGRGIKNLYDLKDSDIIKMSFDMSELQNKGKKSVLFEALLSDYFAIKNETFDKPKSAYVQDIIKDLEISSNIFKNNLEDLNPVILEIISVLNTQENLSCFVGGFVRDTLLGLNAKDVDFVTSIPYDNLINLFTANGFVVKEVGKHFLVLIVSKDGIDVEIANFRKDGTYVDGRRPEGVSIGSIYDDANRRDFTINALYVDTKTNNIIDPTGLGLDDIDLRILRFIGKAEDRIKEDYLRVFRFYRFLSKGFEPESRSLASVRNLFDTAVKNTASERIRTEIERTIKL